MELNEENRRRAGDFTLDIFALKFLSHLINDLLYYYFGSCIERLEMAG